MNSPEKLRALLSGVSERVPSDEEEAKLLAALRMIGPLAARGLPEDPERLDALLLHGARWALYLRSDGAPLPELVAELVAEVHANGDGAEEAGDEEAGE